MVAALLQPGITLLEDASAGNGVVLTTGADFRGVTVPEAPATSTPGAEATTTTVVGIAPPAQTPPGETCT
jgi:hypothetical protein